jgi:hypothetical protein
MAQKPLLAVVRAVRVFQHLGGPHQHDRISRRTVKKMLLRKKIRPE